MKLSISTWDHKCDSKGNMALGGQVEVNPGINFCPADGGCGNKGCTCSPGYWLTVTEGYSPLMGVSSGITIAFPNHARMVEFLTEFQNKISDFLRSPKEPMGV